MADGTARPSTDTGAAGRRPAAALDLAERGEVLDACLYTAPGQYGGGGAGTTWLVGSADDVAAVAAQVPELGDHPLRALRHPVPARDRPGRDQLPLPLLRQPALVERARPT